MTNSLAASRGDRQKRNKESKTNGIGLGACITSKATPSRVNASLLRSLPQVQQEPIDAAVKTLSAAKRAYSTARKQTRIAGEAVDQARRELSVVTHHIHTERVTLAAVRRREDAKRLPAVQAKYIELLGVGRTARYGLALSRREHELAALQERLSLEELRLADAQLEVARATAIEGLNVRAKDAVPLEDIRENAGFHGREVAVAYRRLTDATSRMVRARSDFESAINAQNRSEQAAR